MSARDHALIQLNALRLPGWPPVARLRRRIAAMTDPRDFALAEQISIGVIKNLLLLQRQIVHYSRKPLHKIDPVVQKILAIAIYQLKFLDRIPASAAVNEAVGQTRRFGKARSSGFVNAVLRNVGRESELVLPDAAANPSEYSEIALSHPRELFERLQLILGVEAALEFCRHDNQEPPTLVRLFAGVTVEQLQRGEIRILPHEVPGMFVVEGASKSILSDWARGGLAQVQDATAAGVVGRMDIRSGMRVLDRCAGRGTKTLQIQEIVGPDGSVNAVDASAARCRSIVELIEHRKLLNVSVHHAAELAPIGSKLPGRFDRILIDVPCSNSGVMARRPEARYRQSAGAIKCLTKVQMQILQETAAWLDDGGRMAYSTCSVWPQENEELIGRFLKQNEGFRLIHQSTTLPRLGSSEANAYRDGGYVAILGRGKTAQA